MAKSDWTPPAASPPTPPAPTLKARRVGLTVKQAVATLAIALVLGVAGSFVELLIDWRTMRDEVRATTGQMLELVRGSAVEAAFQLNPELARQVVDGMLRTETVEQVSLRDNYGAVLAAGHGAAASGGGRLAGWLFGDVAGYSLKLARADSAGLVKDLGMLDLTLSPQAVGQRFLARAAINAVSNILRALAIAGGVVVLFTLMVTRPLVRLAQLVGVVDPARPGEFLVPPFRGHHGDELGQLVGSLNGLLQAFQRGLHQRDRAEAGLTALTRELEDRVAQRTRDLDHANHEIRALNRRLEAENLRLGAELDVSRRIQQMILPTEAELAEIVGLDVAAYMEPANEVGGDYYDILHREAGRVRIGIGDVTGHGLESGVVMLMTQSAVRTLVTSDETDAVKVMEILNRTIGKNIERMGSDKNLTLALLDYRPVPPGERVADGAAGHLRISGQHESVVVVRRGGHIEVVDTIDLGMPLSGSHFDERR